MLLPLLYFRQPWSSLALLPVSWGGTYFLSLIHTLLPPYFFTWTFLQVSHRLSLGWFIIV